MTAKISFVDQWGLMKIDFSNEFLPMNNSLLDESVLDISIKPYDTGERVAKLGLNWWCTEFKERTMNIKLNFTHPLFVSAEGTDRVQVVVKNSTFFKRMEYQRFLPKDYKMTKNLFT